MLSYFNLFNTKKDFYSNFKMFEIKTYDILNKMNFKINETNADVSTLFDLEGVHYFSSFDIYDTSNWNIIYFESE